MRKFCKHYCGEFCTTGGCPIDNKEELEEYGADVPHSCKDCWYNKQCRDCIFFATPYCGDHEIETQYVIDELLDRVSRIIVKYKKNEKGE